MGLGTRAIRILFDSVTFNQYNTVMQSGDGTPWTIRQLATQVAEALAAGAPGAPNGRIREIPDQRTIRYYTTLGLIDRPAAMEGRTALYGRRHFLQIVAIKRLQGRGLSLVEVQKALAGASDERLRQLAEVSQEADRHQAALTPPSEPPARRFWKSRPAAFEMDERVRTLQAIELAPDLTLLLKAQRAPAPADLSALRKAAAPLIRYLLEHQLIPKPAKGDDDEQAASPDD